MTQSVMTAMVRGIRVADLKLTIRLLQPGHVRHYGEIGCRLCVFSAVVVGRGSFDHNYHRNALMVSLS